MIILCVSFELLSMVRRESIHRLFCRVILAVALVAGQVSIILASPVASCLPGTGAAAPVASSQDHHCCCGEMDTCCCHVGQGSTAAWPDMALPAVSGGEYNPAPSTYATLDTGSQSPLQPPILAPAGRWTGTGPPLSLSYLVNVTFRC